MTRALVAAALSLLATAATAQTPPKPRLIVAIAVDQFSADLFAEYRAHFTGGLKRLSSGVVFPSGYQSHAATETCPGHSTILTGAHPARTGLIANSWVDQSVSRADKNVYCAEDETLGRSSKAGEYVPSTVHLKVPTLGDRMKDADPRARVVAVAGKDRAAIMMGGHKTDAIWFLDPRDASRFLTLSGRGTSAAAARANAAISASIARAQGPMPLSPFCATRSRAVPISATKSVGEGRFARAAGAGKQFRASPESDAAVFALAGDLVSEMRLGKGEATDLIAIGASATDFVGHSYGTEGSEMCLQLTALDTVMGAFFARLDKAKIDYLVVLTADHGGHDAPERNDQNAAPDAQRVASDFTFKRLEAMLREELGLAKPVLASAELGDVWLDRGLTAEERARVLPRAVALLKAQPQVAQVFTAAEIAATPIAKTPPETWSLIERARASFDPQRSGDLLVLLKPRVTPIPAEVAGGGSYIATHGSPYDYDRRVPVLFWRKGMAGFEQPNSIDTVDIAPTLAAIIGVPLPAAETDGQCRDLIAGAASSCP